jgi:type III restriction enzyme
MPRPKKSDLQSSLLELRLSTAPCVPEIRRAVAAWRNSGYKGVSKTSGQLLNYWFKNDHRLPNGTQFIYHDSQREAIETLIYIFEVAGIRRFKELVETYAPNDPNLKLLQFDDFARYCLKMATGSGKTKVVSLAIAWHYFNAVCENRP